MKQRFNNSILGKWSEHQKIYTKINIKMLENEFGTEPNSFLLALKKFVCNCNNLCNDLIHQ